jgi:predicted AAA+ superfamily ATPase
MSVKKEGYKTRLADKKLSEYLKLFGAVSVEGPKWCGKTWTSLNHANSVSYIMDPAGNYANKTRAEINPSLILDGKVPHVIDEWQEVPGIWDAVRFDVDKTPGFGKYILTGSVTPPRESYKHSGAGRIAIIRMRPMTLFESGDSAGLVSLADVFSNKKIKPFTADIDLAHLIDITIRGGWPQTLNLPKEKAGSVSIEYINALIKNDLFGSDFSRRNPAKLKILIKSLARNNSTTVNESTLTADYNGESESKQNNETSLSRNSVQQYLYDLKRIFVIEDIPGWDPGIRSKTRIRSTTKIMFADPSLAIAALCMGRRHLLDDLNTYGFMFENLCMRDLYAYAEYYGGSLYHYRDNSSLEVDAIIEMQDGSWGGFEIKLGENQIEKAAHTLNRLKNKMISNGAREPSCLAVITGGGLGRKREDGIYVIPINSLKP